MTDLPATIRAGSPEILLVALDVAAKASALLTLALAAHLAIGRRRAAVRSALWNACLVGLILLPATSLAFPRLSLPILPSRRSAPSPELVSSSPAPVATDPRTLTGLSGPTTPTPQRDFGVAPAIASSRNGNARMMTGRSRGDTVRNFAAICAGLYLAVVVLLAARLTATLAAVRRLTRHSEPFENLAWSESLTAWRARLGIARHVGLATSDRVAVPAVVGWLRPSILIPRGLDGSAGRELTEAVLLHELAHVRRGDYGWNLVRKFVQILYWPHPLTWPLGRIAGATREQACDDLCIHLLGGSANYRASLIEVAAWLIRRPDATLGIGMTQTTSLGRRLDWIDRSPGATACVPRPPARAALAGAALAIAAVLGSIELTSAGAIGEPDLLHEGWAKSAIGLEIAVQDPSRDFEMLVVGPGGAPIPEATVDLRTEPAPNSDQIRRGKFVRKTSYGTYAETDAEGRLHVAMPKKPGRLDVTIIVPAFGPYWASWSPETQEAPPARFTAELEEGWSVGGMVVDPMGKPVGGAAVQLSIPYKKRPGDRQSLYVGDAPRTDAGGHWRFDSVPASMGEVHVAIDHPGFAPARRTLGRAAFGLVLGEEPVARISLERGLTVFGKVTDEDGKPISGARIRSKFVNEVRVATTVDDGTYALTGCEARRARIVVSAKGRAMDMKELDVEAGMASVDFRMKPGGTIRILVRDARGEPTPWARIFFQKWRGRVEYFEFDHLSRFTDENGLWAWDEAPIDELKADICPSLNEGMQLVQQSLVARDAEYVFRLPAALVVSGRVVDAETKAPIQDIWVVPGRRPSAANLIWDETEGVHGTGGRYEFRRFRAYPSLLVRVGADGYLTAESREFAGGEGRVSVDFELRKSHPVAAKVVTPDLAPAAGALVVLGVAGDHIHVTNGQLGSGPTVGSRRVAADDGGFLFEPPAGTFQVFITHPAGYAQVKSAPDWEAGKTIRLEPWSGVEGIFRIGARPAANVPLILTIFGRDQNGHDGPQVNTKHVTTTGPDGRYSFDRVIPGRGRIGRDLRLPDVENGGKTSSCKISADFPAGQVVHLDLGGKGRIVVGRLLAPEGFAGKVRWGETNVTLLQDNTRAREDRTILTATIDPEGAYRLDDVPAGRYTLYFHSWRDSIGSLSKHHFDVPPTSDNPSEQAFDLGPVRLDNVARVDR